MVPELSCCTRRKQNSTQQEVSVRTTKSTVWEACPREQSRVISRIAHAALDRARAWTTTRPLLCDGHVLRQTVRKTVDFDVAQKGQRRHLTQTTTLFSISAQTHKARSRQRRMLATKREKANSRSAQNARRAHGTTRTGLQKHGPGRQAYAPKPCAEKLRSRGKCTVWRRQHVRGRNGHVRGRGVAAPAARRKLR